VFVTSEIESRGERVGIRGEGRKVGRLRGRVEKV